MAKAGTVSDHQLWTGAIFTTRPVTSWRLLGWLDLHDRRRQDSTLFVLRPGLGYQWFARLSVHAGYAWIPTYVDEAADRHEHRSWQQLLFNAPAPQGWALLIRPRLEQRFAQGGKDTGHRLRLLARIAYTFRSGVLFVFWNECLYQLNNTDWRASAGFDQNRAFAGIGLPAMGKARLEVGYVNAFIKRSPDNHLDHNLAVSLFWTY